MPPESKGFNIMAILKSYDIHLREETALTNQTQTQTRETRNEISFLKEHAKISHKLYCMYIKKKATGKIPTVIPIYF